MTIRQRDTANLFYLKLTIECAGRKKDETYWLKETSQWDVAVAAGSYLAYVRAATLGRGVRITKAIVAQYGIARKSRQVNDNPLPGTMGVSFLEANASETGVNTNTLGAGLEFRFETAAGDFIVRKFLGICDAFVNNNRWCPDASQPGRFGFLNLTGDIDVNGAWPSQELFAIGTTYSPTRLNRDFKPYPTAWAWFLWAFRTLTDYKRPGYIDDNDQPHPPENVPWTDVIFQGVCSAKVKALKGV